ncbi:MAG: yhhT [Bacteroidetes bacterium]|jgi:predicted PurR-regulated permease PerM|nr:yhhT [Bacteroidota bacterium]
MIKKLQENIPFYFKASILLLGLIAFFFVIYIAQNILLPFVFSVLMAILLDSVVGFLIRKGMNRILAISLTLFTALLLIAGLILFITSQLNTFSDDLPNLREKFNALFKDITAWASDTFNLSTTKVNAWVNKKTSEGMGNTNAVIGSTVMGITHFFILMLLIPVYIFLILFYKPLLLKFASKLFPPEKYETVQDVLTESKTLIQQYLVGLLIEMAIVASLTAIGLSIIGIQSPVLFGVITALLNTIPYVGVLVANLLFATVALVTKSPTSALLVLALFGVVQFIDNNLIVPRVVGSKVKINALATIATVLIGGELCGIAGMFLAIPVTAVFKVICDRIEPLEPIGYLLGDEMPSFKRNAFAKPKSSTTTDK